MKVSGVIILLWLTIGALAVFNQGLPQSFTFQSESRPSRNIKRLQKELKAKEDQIASFTSQLHHAKANAPICSMTGRKMEVQVVDDPRPRLQKEIAGLRMEILKARRDR
jgi:hypothetical protein